LKFSDQNNYQTIFIEYDRSSQQETRTNYKDNSATRDRRSSMTTLPIHPLPSD